MEQLQILKEESVFKIHTILNLENSLELIKILLNYVEEEKINFNLDSKQGSIINEFSISVGAGLFSSVLYDLIKRIFILLKNKQDKPVQIFTLKKKYFITGDERSILPEELKTELLG